jgi:hypothetical protein
VVTTQVRSLLISLTLILLLTSLHHRSWFWGALSVLPCAVAVLVILGFMGWTGLPLGVATSMFQQGDPLTATVVGLLYAPIAAMLGLGIGSVVARMRRRRP